MLSEGSMSLIGTFNDATNMGLLSGGVAVLLLAHAYTRDASGPSIERAKGYLASQPVGLMAVLHFGLRDRKSGQPPASVEAIRRPSRSAVATAPTSCRSRSSASTEPGF